jgi:hypothetical protein
MTGGFGGQGVLAVCQQHLRQQPGVRPFTDRRQLRGQHVDRVDRQHDVDRGLGTTFPGDRRDVDTDVVEVAQCRLGVAAGDARLPGRRRDEETSGLLAVPGEPVEAPAPGRLGAGEPVGHLRGHLDGGERQQHHPGARGSGLDVPHQRRRGVDAEPGGDVLAPLLDAVAVDRLPVREQVPHLVLGREEEQVVVVVADEAGLVLLEQRAPVVVVLHPLRAGRQPLFVLARLPAHRRLRHRKIRQHHGLHGLAAVEPRR